MSCGRTEMEELVLLCKRADMTMQEVDELFDRCARLVLRCGEEFNGKYRHRIEDVLFTVGGAGGATPAFMNARVKCDGVGGAMVFQSYLVDGRWDHCGSRFNSHHAPRVLRLLRQAMVLDDLAAV
jgi:hypothetical protein